jgi:hypothetical protein
MRGEPNMFETIKYWLEVFYIPWSNWDLLDDPIAMDDSNDCNCHRGT